MESRQPGMPASPSLSEATLAGGCFWGVQGVFQHVKGVQRAVSGYSGGAASNASYELVSRGNTGHAESVEVTFDPSQISYGALLQIFFSLSWHKNLYPIKTGFFKREHYIKRGGKSKPSLSYFPRLWQKNAVAIG